MINYELKSNGVKISVSAEQIEKALSKYLKLNLEREIRDINSDIKMMAIELKSLRKDLNDLNQTINKWMYSK